MVQRTKIINTICIHKKKKKYKKKNSDIIVSYGFWAGPGVTQSLFLSSLYIHLLPRAFSYYPSALSYPSVLSNPITFAPRVTFLRKNSHFMRTTFNAAAARPSFRPSSEIYLFVRFSLFHFSWHFPPMYHEKNTRFWSNIILKSV